jgi:hypothetical protein
MGGSLFRVLLNGMKKAGWIRLFKKFHKWPGMVIAFFAILYALSGIVLNHRETFSSFDIPRKLMPPGYQYKNWNLAAVRGSILVGSDSLLIYGNIGIWLTDDEWSGFSDFNHGFPDGIDNRKVYALEVFEDRLVAATHFGLYATGIDEIKWNPVKLPVRKKRVADLAIKNDTLLILTRSHLLKTADLEYFITVQLNNPVGYERKVGLFNTLWDLHSGELFGMAGRLFVDILGVTVIWLSVSGLLHFIFPGWIKRRKALRNEYTKLVAAKRWNLHWHNVIGYWAVFFLVVNTLAGMFLRPPLLIPIATKQVGIIPYTHLDNDNAWHDKLRRVSWNDSLEAYIFSTSAGFYVSDETLGHPLIPVPSQPSVSVMGLNVFEPLGHTSYMVGSFTGMYIWDIGKGLVNDFFTGMPVAGPATAGRPVGANMVAGWVAGPEPKAWWFDYNRGAVAMGGNLPFPEMSREMIAKTPSSWWNFALEVHTGRIFEHLIGPFYILIVPLAGLSLVIVLISGFLIWWMGYRKKKS